MSTDPNYAMLVRVARRLGDLREEVVFVGGAIMGLLVTDPAVAPLRATDDVDVIVEVATRTEYEVVAQRLRKLGFEHDVRKGAPICRFVVDGIKADVMPTDETILGFSNRWYSDALDQADTVDLEEGLSILLITAPLFLSTKLEAWKGRGGGDHRLSHDLEDLIAVVDGRVTINREVQAAPAVLRDYLAEEVGQLLDDPGFHDALPGLLGLDSRVPIVIERLERLAGRSWAS